MLSKLLKYDLKWVYKILIIFYVLTIIFSGLGRIFTELGTDSLIFNVVGKIINGCAVAMIINGIINSFIRCWVRFKLNIYGDESYLTHTLPVKKSIIYLSKILTAIITIFTSSVVGVIGVAIMYYSKTNIEILKSILEIAATTYNSTVIKLLIIISFILFLEILFVEIVGYVGIILGNRANNNKLLKSVAWSIGFYIISQDLMLVIIYITGLFNSNIMNLFTSSNVTDINVIKLIMNIVICIYTVFIFIHSFVGYKLFKKGVNVD